jgi:AraC family transcriptional regulator
MTIGCPSLFEHRSKIGPLSTCLHRPGMLMVTPAGPVPELRSLTAADFVHCALDKTFTQKVSEEMNRPSGSTPAFRLGLRDRSIQHLLSMLKEELVTQMPFGRLYVDSLAHALASRFLLLNEPAAKQAKPQVSALPAPILRLVKEKIEANIDGDLSLESLAEETRYSRAHFLRMFRAATGTTPHQYVLNIRLKRAQEQLRKKGSRIIDVAMSCGFSSQSHLSYVFKQYLEMTPAEFRRSA